MPIYEYEYVNKNKERKRVERRMKMSEMVPSVEVVEDGTVYLAKRIISQTARMAENWDSYEPSDLPPVDHPAF